MQDINIANISENVLQAVNRAELKKQSMHGVLELANKPIVEAITNLEKKALKEMKLQTVAISEVSNAISIMSETLSVVSDLLYDSVEGMDDSPTNEVMLKLSTDDNTESVISELGILANNQDDLGAVIEHFAELGDVLQSSFSGIDVSMEKLTEYSEKLTIVKEEEKKHEKEEKESIKDIGAGILMMAGGLALLGVTVALIAEHVNPITFGAVALGIALLGFSVRNFNADAGKGMILASASIGLLALSLQLFDDVSMGSILKMSLSVIGLTVGMLIISKVANPIKASLGLAIASASVGLLALTIQMFDDVEVGSILKTGLALATLGLGFYILGKNIVSIGLGAIGVLLIGGSLIVLTSAIKGISDTSIDLTNVLKFGAIAGALALGYGILGGAIIPIGLGAVAIGLIGGSLMILTKGISLIATSKMPNENQLTSFGNAVKGVSDALSSVGLIRLGKITLAAPMLIAMGTATTSIAKGIKSFSSIGNDPMQVEMAVQSIDMFVNGFANTMSVNEGKFEQIKGGINSLRGIGNLMSGIAGGVRDLGNLQFNEYEVRNGELVLKSTRSMTPEDFQKVGKSIGMVINALTEPLAKVGAKGSGTTFSLFGYDVFAVNSNDVQQGIQALSGLGSVFTPIVNAVVSMTKEGIGEHEINDFKNNIGLLLSAVTSTISSFIIDEEASGGSMDKLLTFSNITKSFMEIFSQNDLNPTISSLGLMAENLGSVRDVLSEIDLDKLNKLNDIIYNTSHFEEVNLQMMADLIDKITEMLGVVGTRYSSTNSRSATRSSTKSRK